MNKVINEKLNFWIELGPPGAPDGVTVEEITDSTAQLSWRPGQDNGSPILSYTVQTKTAFTVGWQAVNTGKKNLCLAEYTGNGSFFINA